MKIISLLLLVQIILINSVDYSNGHYLILDDNDSTIDGQKLTSTAQNGVSISSSSNLLKVSITSGGTYILSGRLSGQLEINMGNNDKITLVLDGVKITCSSNLAVFIKSGYEFFSGNSINYETAKSLDFSNAGAKIIIADDSTNSISGSYTTSNEGTFSSQISMVISGETKGNGLLNIESDYEGIEVRSHLLIEGGIINIAAQNDGININQESVSVCIIRGGQLLINGGLGSEGDGIDSNGYLIIEGGTVISASKPQGDSGLDSNLGFMINGGIAIGVGSSMDGADKESAQPAMNLKFAVSVGATNTLKITDSDGNEIISFCPSTAGFNGSIRGYGGATISSPKFSLGSVYYLYLDDKQLVNTGTSSGSGSGHGGSSSSSSGTETTEFTLTYSGIKYIGIKQAS